MSDDEARQVAEKLNKGQRGLIRALSADWRQPSDLRPFATPINTGSRDPALVEMLHLKRRKYRLTPLGLRVRAVLLEEQPHG